MTAAEFKAWKVQAGLSYAQAATVLGVSSRTVMRYASGATSVPGPIVKLVALCENFKLNRP